MELRYRFACLIIATCKIMMVTAFVTPAMAATIEQCRDFVGRPGVYESGRLSNAYRELLRQSGRAVSSDGVVDRNTIMNGCSAGAFDEVINVSEGNPPLKGRSNYTEPEARAIIEKSGYSSITNLTRHGDGIWRANAMQSSKPVSVMIEDNGNVVGK